MATEQRIEFFFYKSERDNTTIDIQKVYMRNNRIPLREEKDRKLSKIILIHILKQSTKQT